MASLSAGKAIMAKAKAQNSRRLKASHYHELLRKENISAIVAYLRSDGGYEAELRNLNEGELERSDLENCLTQSIVRLYVEFQHYAPDKQGFYSYVLKEQEVEQLIHMLRLLHRGAPMQRLPYLPDFILPYLDLDLSKLMRVTSFAELLLGLKGTPYDHILTACQDNSPEGFDYLSAETVLARHLAEMVFQRIAALPQAALRKQLQQYYAAYWQLQNLKLIYRFKAYPGISAARARSYLIATEKGSHPQELNSLLGAANQEEFLARLPQTKLGHALGDPRAYSLLGRSYFGLSTTRLHFRNSQNLLNFATEGPAAYMALVMLDRIEVDNLITLIEGAYYGLPAARVEPLLVF